jgi:hypothetical protein
VDKVSAAEMKNVAVAVATSAWLLASADDGDATVVLNIIAGAAARRLAVERTQGAALVAQAADAAAAGATEQRVRAAWIKWYEEALDSLERLPVGGTSDTLRSRIAAARHAISLQSKH